MSSASVFQFLEDDVRYTQEEPNRGSHAVAFKELHVMLTTSKKWFCMCNHV